MYRLIAIAVLVLVGCGTPRATADGNASSPSRTASGERNPSPAPSPSGAPVAARVLPPSTVMPIGSLCVTDVFQTADGNFEPRFCGDGSVNVAAWERYAPITPNILAAGLHPSLDALDAAFSADFGGHATDVEELYGYQLAAAYYGWSFTPNPACEFIYKMPVCY